MIHFMKNGLKRINKAALILLFSIMTSLSFGQVNDESEIKMVSEFTDNEELRDLLNFEGINYLKIKFVGGKELKSKGYKIIAKEITDGKVTLDSTIINTKMMGVERFETINDTVLSFSVLAKQTEQNKLKMQFNFPGFSVTREFDAIDTEDDYSLRNIANESDLNIEYGKIFYLLAYILPYDIGNGFKSYCEVGRHGKDILQWGEKFGLKHYILFEMTID